MVTAERPIYNQACPDCGSSDALTIYPGSHTHCYSCSAHKFMDKGNVQAEVKVSRGQDRMKEMEVGGEFTNLVGEDAFLNRGLTEKACEAYGVKVKRGEDGKVEKIIFPYFTDRNQYAAQKVRVKEKFPKGLWVGDVGNTKTFFGQQLWSGGKRLTITEGEFDAVAVYQMFGYNYPVVSLRNGADKTGTGPAAEIKHNYDYLKNFEEIVLCFDNDEPGQASAQKVAQLFPPGKVKIMHMSRKDANEYLLAGDIDGFKKAFWNARPHSPQGIVYGTDLGDRIIKKLKERKEKSNVRYPWEGLNKLTYGIRTGEMVTVISGTGSGKSLFIGEGMYHILKNTDEKIGVMMLEESVEMANLRMASIHAGKPYHLPDTEWTEDEIREVLKETVELTDEEGNARVISFDHFGSNGIDELLHRVDHMVALGCRYLFLDHISIVVSDQQHGDERRALDEIATKLRTKVQEHDVALFVVSHLRRTNAKPHEEGGQTSLADIRGTQAIAQLSDMVIGLERNGQADDEIERNTTTIRVLKNRMAGLTGVATRLFYTKESGRLIEVEQETFQPEEKKDEPKVEMSGPQAPLSKEPIEDWDSGDELPF